MSAKSSERGFTMIELVMVIMLVGLLAAVVVPKVTSTDTARASAYRDGLAAGLRYAHAVAQGHRRLVCASVSTSTGLTLTIAAANPATSCASALVAPDGTAVYAAPPAGIATTVAPSAVLYFQPGGTITSDGAGSTPATFTITPSGEAAISVVGDTGHVQ